MRFTWLFGVSMYFLSLQVDAQILTMRERAEVINAILEDRLTHLLPKLMEREAIDMWLLISREYNEDPILKTLLPATWLSARRRTILVLYNPGEGKAVERFAVARYSIANVFDKAWDKETQPDQWQALVDLIELKKPQKIAVNQSSHFALADGMTATEMTELKQALSKLLADKLVSSEPLALAWLETRSKMEMDYYPLLTDIGHSLIARAFSKEVIKPGVTTTTDVEWWLAEQTRSLRLLNWFHPSVSLQRADRKMFEPLTTFSQPLSGEVILPGDLLHVDFGIQYLRLHSDQQQHAYVLREGETDAPQYLKQALANANRLQDIFTQNFVAGQSGNNILKLSRQQAIAQGIKPTIYTHPIGSYGHAAGTTIGLWDAQQGVAVQGDYPLHKDTAYSIELNAATMIPQWGKEIRVMLEEQGFFDGEKLEYLSGRQTAFHLIK